MIVPCNPTLFEYDLIMLLNLFSFLIQGGNIFFRSLRNRMTLKTEKDRIKLRYFGSR